MQHPPTNRNIAEVTISRAEAMGTTMGLHVAAKHCRKLGRKAREQEGKTKQSRTIVLANTTSWSKKAEAQMLTGWPDAEVILAAEVHVQGSELQRALKTRSRRDGNQFGHQHNIQQIIHNRALMEESLEQ